ncbi:MAG: hypothetical protein WCP06_12085 [Verrucomicrobiota bacterium]
MKRILVLPLLCCAFVAGCSTTSTRQVQVHHRFGDTGLPPIEVVPEQTVPGPETVPPPAPMPTPAPQVAQPTPPPVPVKRDLQYGKPVPGKPGYVTSPFAPNAGLVDVRGWAPGTEVKDPYTGKVFLVP